MANIDSNAFYELIIQSDFGWGGNLLALIMILGISFAIVRKTRETMYIQFPLVLCAKIFLPLLSPALIVISLAIFVINIMGSKNDFMDEVKNIPQKIRDRVMLSADMVKQSKRAIKKDMIGQKFALLDEKLKRKYNR